ncbi:MULTISPECIES: hypothetical protein [unclassified Brevibacterium]|jgi:hypothetical protein|uniref:hypothetical protein n=1 Tax=unclassified Brevibacterium TaxID=2614124 RepID=UPI001080353D|nr:hypothetical protein [Brevibacterium sp. S111]TGD08591.1 hypothetical protein EB836_17100 [Brevibacterium sp. S111]
MSDEKKNLPENTEEHGTDDDREIKSSAVGVGPDPDAEGSSQTPEERLERIAAEHEVPIERDPEDAQAKAEGSSPDKDRDISGGDTKEEEDDSVEPPD